MTQFVFIHGPGAGGCADSFVNQLNHFPGSLAPNLPGHPEGESLPDVKSYTEWLRDWLKSQNAAQDLVLSGFTLGAWGKPEEGIELLERGLELNPLDPRNFNFMAHLSMAYLGVSKYEAAVHWGREATRRNPEFFESHVNLASALGYLDRGAEARELLARFDESASSYLLNRIWMHQASYLTYTLFR